MAQQTKKNVLVLNVAEIVYYFYFFIMAFAKGMGLYDGMWPYTAALLLGGLLIVCKLALTEHTLVEWLFVLGMLALGILVWHNSGEKGALIYIAMIVAMKNVPVKRVFSVGLAVWGITFIAQVILTLTGIRQDIFVIHAKLGLGYIIRWSLGQPHPNVLQITSMMLCAFILYLADWKGKKLIYATVLMLIGNLYIFFYSVSYTGLIVVVVYLFGNLYLSFRKELNKLEKLLVMLVFPMCAAFSILGPLTFPERLWEICNKVLNTRFNIARIHMTTDPITLFGARPSDAIPKGLWNIDCSYVFALMHYGVVFFLLLCIGYIALVWHCLKKKKYQELAIIIGLSVAAITEPFFVNPSFKNISLLFMGAFLFDRFNEFAYKKPDHVLNKKIGLLTIGKKEVVIPIEKTICVKNQFLQVVKMQKKFIIIGTIAIMVMAGILFAVMADMPKCYYALRSSTQIEEERMYLDIDQLPEDFDGKILNYQDAKTPMQKVEGNIVTVEYVRGIISSGLWCGFFGGGIISLIAFIFLRRRIDVT